MRADEHVVTIRAAGSADAEAIATIYRHYVLTSGSTFDETPPEPTELVTKIRDIQGSGLPFLVAESDGAVAGYGYCILYRARPAYRFTAENSIYVDPTLRGRGLGRSLLEALLPATAAAGIRQVVAVIADTGDPASVRLHERCGFVHRGRLHAVGFKHDRWLDTILMQIDLTALPGRQ
jgi:L-amino acid N-acyltransferase YncA